MPGLYQWPTCFRHHQPVQQVHGCCCCSWCTEGHLQHIPLVPFSLLVVVNAWLLYHKTLNSSMVHRKTTLCTQARDLSKRRREQPSSDVERKFEKHRNRGPAKPIIRAHMHTSTQAFVCRQATDFQVTSCGRVCCKASCY